MTFDLWDIRLKTVIQVIGTENEKKKGKLEGRQKEKIYKNGDRNSRKQFMIIGKRKSKGES